MNHTPIYVSREDNSRLRLLIATALYSDKTNSSLRKLQAELDRAFILDPADVPLNAVTLNSTVEFEDLGTGEVEEYTITFPEKADIDRKKISILAPIGTALIGCRVGDIVKWSMPGGIRQLRVCRVTQPEGSKASVSSTAQSASFATT